MWGGLRGLIGEEGYHVRVKEKMIFMIPCMDYDVLEDWWIFIEEDEGEVGRFGYRNDRPFLCKHSCCNYSLCD